MTSKDTALRLLRTSNSYTPTVLRVALGTVMFAHGAQKAFGWFDGYGFDGTMGFLTGAIGLPAPLAFLVIVAELAGGLALIAGFAGRLAAAGIAIVMVGAVATSHLDNGFFMNWTGAAQGEGFEFHLLAIALAGGVVLSGSGALSVDRVLARVLEASGQPRRSPAPALAAH